MTLRETIAFVIQLAARHQSSDEILDAQVDINIPKSVPINQVVVDIHRDEENKMEWIHIS